VAIGGPGLPKEATFRGDLDDAGLTNVTGAILVVLHVFSFVSLRGSRTFLPLAAGPLFWHILPQFRLQLCMIDPQGRVVHG